MGTIRALVVGCLIVLGLAFAELTPSAFAKDSVFQRLKDPSIARDGGFEITVRIEAEAVDEALQEAAAAVVRKRVGGYRCLDCTVASDADGQLTVRIHSTRDVERVTKLIETGGVLKFHQVDDTPSTLRLAIETGRSRVGFRLIEDTYGQPLLIKFPEIFDGNAIKAANSGYDPDDNSPAINFRLMPEFVDLFHKFTLDNRGEQFAVVLDDVAITVPRINDPITEGHVQITGYYTLEEAEDLALILDSGSLPAALNVEAITIIAPLRDRPNAGPDE